VREISHLGSATELPPPMPLRELPWMRRERIDADLRRAIHELRALVKEDSRWDVQYEALADALEGAVLLIDAIEDFDNRHSVRV
jgi:hypothetical protein